MKKINIYSGDDDTFNFVFSDLEKTVDDFETMHYKTIWRYKWIYSIHKKLLCKKTKLVYLFDYILSPFLNNLFFKKTSGNIYVFSTISIYCVPVYLIKYLRKNNKVVVFALDDMNSVFSKGFLDKRKKVLFDAVYSFDKEDSKKYGFFHIYGIYPTLKGFKSYKCSLDYEYLLLLSEKGRQDKIKKVYDSISNNENIFFSINYVEDKKIIMA